jgi:hypothetical protein
MRVSNFIELARPVSDDMLSRFAQVALAGITREALAILMQK